MIKKKSIMPHQLISTVMWYNLLWTPDRLPVIAVSAKFWFNYPLKLLLIIPAWTKTRIFETNSMEPNKNTFYLV